MAIDALDLDSRAHFAIEFCVPVSVLIEVAVDAVHPLFHVDIHHMNRHTIALFPMDLLKLFRRRYCGHQIFGRWAFHCFSCMVKQLSCSVFFENGPVNPSMPMEVCKLSVLQFWVEVAHIVKKLWITP